MIRDALTGGAALENTNQKSKNKKNTSKHRGRFFMIIYLLVLVLLLGTLYFFPWISNRMADVMVAEYGELNSSQEQTFYIVKDETIYVADQSGKAGYSFREGAIARRGVQVVDIKRDKNIQDTTDYSTFNSRVNSFMSGDTLLRKIDTDEKDRLVEALKAREEKVRMQAKKLKLQLAIQSLEYAGSFRSKKSSGQTDYVSQAALSGDYTMETSGLISYEVDGYEAVLSPYTMKYLDRNEVKSIRKRSINLFDGTVTKGEPVFKVVNNREWYALAWTSRDESKCFQKGKVITLKLDSGDVRGTVYRVIRQGGDYLVILRFTTFCENLATLRKEKCTVVTSNDTGLLIRESFITEKEGDEGVYVISVTGEAVFTRINVITRDNGYVLVSSGSFRDTDGTVVNTVNVCDEIKKVD